MNDFAGVFTSIYFQFFQFFELKHPLQISSELLDRGDSRSANSLYVSGQPAAIKERFTGPIQAQVDKPTLSRTRLHPVRLIYSIW